jgi:oligopeptide/dipeptide ABC transporter ATP-binding protein
VTAATHVLEVDRLSVRQKATGNLLLRDVWLAVERGHIVGLVGESGSGKSMTALALMGLLPSAMEPVSGDVEVGGKAYRANERGRTRPDVAMIFQNPRSALNPTMRVGKQVERICRLRDGGSKSEARERAHSLLQQVGIPGVESVARSYPHQLSGGMCQRVMIAMALASRPTLLIADEPTTGLDVTVQAQIMSLLVETVKATSCGILLITHDLAVVNQVCDRVAVMYGGQVMEFGPTDDVLDSPRSPYTKELLASLTDDQPTSPADDVGVDFSLAGCRLARRCAFAADVCSTRPPTVRIGRQDVVCHRAEEVA